MTAKTQRHEEMFSGTVSSAREVGTDRRAVRTVHGCGSLGDRALPSVIAVALICFMFCFSAVASVDATKGADMARGGLRPTILVAHIER